MSDTRSDASTPQDLAAWSQHLEQASAEEILKEAIRRFDRRVAIVTSFQDTGTVLIDMAHRAGLAFRVMTLDTGRLPEETYEQIDRIREHYDLRVEVIAPERQAVEELVEERGPNLFRHSRRARISCCDVRKVQPFRRASAGLDVWIAGLRREHSGERSAVNKVEIDLANRPDGSLLKIHPLADWSSKRIWRYLRDYEVPYHPLYDRGYHSIGCAPCTRPTRPGEEPRSARWWWEEDSKECGLHLVQLQSRPTEPALQEPVGTSR